MSFCEVHCLLLFVDSKLSDGLFAEVFVEECFYLGKGDDILPVIEVGMACARDDHEELVVLLTGKSR